MISVLTPDEMRAVDEAAPEPVAILIERAGAAVARAAIEMLGGTYGRRVVVIAGKGNNGADGRAAAQRLARRGVRVTIVDAVAAPRRLGPCDLVIDAAFGTGFRGTWVAPEVGDVAVLAVDIPSGVDGLTGVVDPSSQPLRATRTITFAALKPGLLFGQGPALAGIIDVADIGLSVDSASLCGVLTEADVAARLPRRRREAHKWASALLIIGGSPAMAGAPALVAAAAQRAGAGMVRVGIPGGLIGVSEAVGVDLPAEQWSAVALAAADRVHAAVVGPGLGRSRSTLSDVRSLLGRLHCPVVLDADGLAALAGPDDTAESSDPNFGAAAGQITGESGRGGDGHVDDSHVGGGHVGDGLNPTTVGKAAGRRSETIGRAEPSPVVAQRGVGRSTARLGFGAAGRDGRVNSETILPGHRAVLDASARRRGGPLPALGSDARGPGAQRNLTALQVLARRDAPTVLTPHDGEFGMITGHRPAADGGRIGDALRLATATGAVVLLKGPTTVIADPDGSVMLVTEGDERLATAGTGDVLSGTIGALLANGLGPAEAAAVGAWLLGRAARLGPAVGLVAGDLPELIAQAIASVWEHS